MMTGISTVFGTSLVILSDVSFLPIRPASCPSVSTSPGVLFSGPLLWHMQVDPRNLENQSCFFPCKEGEGASFPVEDYKLLKGIMIC